MYNMCNISNKNEIKNFFYVNNIIKIDLNLIKQVNSTLSNLVKVNNLWYYKRVLLLEILFNIKDYETIKFKNKNDNDYRFDNLDVIYNNNYSSIEVIKPHEPINISENYNNHKFIKNIDKLFSNMKI
jgi:hypothetical protein